MVSDNNCEHKNISGNDLKKTQTNNNLFFKVLCPLRCPQTMSMNLVVISSELGRYNKNISTGKFSFTININTVQVMFSFSEYC